MRIKVEGPPYEGDARFSCPGVPLKHKVPPEGNTYSKVPDELYSVMMYAEGEPQRIGMVGSYEDERTTEKEIRWAWYCLVRDERNFLRDEPTAGSAAKRILQQLIEKLSAEEIGGHLSMRHDA